MQNSQQNEFKRGGRVGAGESRKILIKRSPNLKATTQQVQDLRGAGGKNC